MAEKRTTTELDTFNEAARNIVNQGNTGIKDYDSFVAIYTMMYGVYPNIIDIGSDGLYLNHEAKPEDEPVSIGVSADGEIVDLTINLGDDDSMEENETKFRFKDIDVNKTFLKLIENNPDCGVIRNYDFPIILHNETIIFWNKFQRELTVLLQDQQLPQWIVDGIVEKEDEDDKRYFEYVTYGQTGFDTIPLEVKKQEIDLNLNYNDNLPNQEILNFLTSAESGIAILHGHPGTGKTTYIRNLIYTLKKKEFLILDNSVFNYITDSSFISLLMDYKNAVIILEDCESMLMDRAAGNGKLSALLNLSDGIIGDAFNFKFLCTFNANIGKIDKALLRKGRMKIKYEFKPLTADKTKALAESIGKKVKDGESLTLAEIYNYEDKTDYTEEKKSIGFGK